MPIPTFSVSFPSIVPAGESPPAGARWCRACARCAPNATIGSWISRAWPAVDSSPGLPTGRRPSVWTIPAKERRRSMTSGCRGRPFTPTPWIGTSKCCRISTCRCTIGLNGCPVILRRPWWWNRSGLRMVADGSPSNPEPAGATSAGRLSDLVNSLGVCSHKTTHSAWWSWGILAIVRSVR